MKVSVSLEVPESCKYCLFKSEEKTLMAKRQIEIHLRYDVDDIPENKAVSDVEYAKFIKRQLGWQIPSDALCVYDSTISVRTYEK